MSILFLHFSNFSSLYNLHLKRYYQYNTEIFDILYCKKNFHPHRYVMTHVIEYNNCPPGVVSVVASCPSQL